MRNSAVVHEENEIDSHQMIHEPVLRVVPLCWLDSDMKRIAEVSRPLP